MNIVVISTASLPTPNYGYAGMERAANFIAKGLEELGNEVAVIAKEESRVPNHDLYCISDEKHIPNVVSEFELDKWADCFIDVTHDKTLGVARPELPIIHNFQVMSLMGTGANPVFISYGQWHGKFSNIKNAYVIYQPIDLNEMKLYDGQRDNYILYMGQRINEKRIEWACETAIKTNTPLKCFSPGWGDAAYHRMLDEYAEKYPDLISFHSDIGGDEKLHEIQHARALIHPVGANNWCEAGGIIVLESLACGTPVVCARNGALPEYILPDSSNGFVCDSVDEMCNALGGINSIDPDVCRDSVKNFDYHVIAEQWENLCGHVFAGERW